MTYILKRFLVCLVISIVSIGFIFIFDTKTFDTVNGTLLFILTFCETALIKLTYDYYNYRNAKKQKIHNLPILFFYITIAVVEILSVVMIILVTLPYKWLLFIGFAISNILPVLMYQNDYFSLIGVVALSMNSAFLVGFIAPLYFIIPLYIVLSSILIYFFHHRKVKIYTYDNYD